MLCPYCQSSKIRVRDKRDGGQKNTIRRRRGCLSCGRRFTTREGIDTLDLIVIKKDGRKQKFDREKLTRGVLKSCEKRPISPKVVEGLISEVEGRICGLKTREVKSAAIGELVLKGLKKIDGVAYLRFASVFRSFANIDEFEEEIARLLKRDKGETTARARK